MDDRVGHGGKRGRMSGLVDGRFAKYVLTAREICFNSPKTDPDRRWAEQLPPERDVHGGGRLLHVRVQRRVPYLPPTP